MVDYQNQNRLRWDPYILESGDGFTKFWQNHLLTGDRKILYILGKSFDPRTCLGIEEIVGAGEIEGDCWLIDWYDNPVNMEITYLINENYERILEFLSHTRFSVKPKKTPMLSVEGSARRRTGAINGAKLVNGVEEISEYTDIVVDITALPKAVYFPLIGKLMHILDKAPEMPINLHVVACENIEIDKLITDMGVDDSAEYLQYFGGIPTESSVLLPQVWLPILGENQTIHLERIHTFTNPSEICPILPFPSHNPRRGDDLLVTYRDLLFDQWQVEPLDIIYAAEQNPFDVYRQISRVVSRYVEALHPLGGCKIAISSHSSKLLSIGACLAAYELRQQQKKKVGIVHVETQGFNIDNHDASWFSTNNLFSLWLIGECYAT